MRGRRIKLPAAKLTKFEAELMAIIDKHGMDAVLCALSRVCAVASQEPDAKPVWHHDSCRFAHMAQAR